MPRLFVVVVLALLATLLVVPRGHAAVIGDDYPANLKKYARDAKVDPWRFYNRECTSFVAWRITHELNFTQFDDYWLVHWGNASNWKNAATSTAVKKAGVTVDGTPTVGSVAWWSAHSAGSSLGHVAWVAAVSSSSITVEEYNYASPGNYGTRVITRSSSKWPGAFIHFRPVTITNTAKPTILGTPKVGVKLTAKPGSWSVGSTTKTYQWFASGTAIAGATKKSFTPTATQAAKKLKVKVTAAVPGVPSATARSASTPAVLAGTFAVTSPPTISGTPKVGVPMTATPGTWKPAGTYTYQWAVNGTGVSGATGATYTPGPADVGKKVTVTVTGTRAGYTARPAGAAAPTAIAPGTYANTGAARIVGVPRVGASVSAWPGRWTPTGSYRYQWQVAGVALSGATHSAYTPVAADLGQPLTVKVIVSGAGYHSAKSVSKALTVTRGIFTTPTSPSLSGTPQVGTKLVVDPGVWSPAPKNLAYRWFVDGVAVKGVTGTTFVPGPGDRGKQVSVRVTVSRDAYETAAATLAGSAPVVAGVNAAKRAPRISGSPQRGHVLTVNPGSWQVTPRKQHFRWYADGAAIPGATGRAFRLTTAQVGKRISAVETVTATGYRSASATSNISGVVRYGVIGFASAANLTGSLKVGALLRMHAATTTPSQVTRTYQWFRSGTPIAGATAATYRTGAADLGKVISARAAAAAPLWIGASQRASAPATIRSRPTMKITSAVGGARHRVLKMVVRLAAPLITAPGGYVEIRDGRYRLARVHVVKGVARIRVKRMPAKLRQVRVAYLGTSRVFPLTTNSRVRR